ncbi:prepilin-type N-terminal cleavage/methylation domain-containing protein [Rarobacter incanus]|uniref:Prepilin-type N-terminal cleavage/methylation domain-containing protein n=1 Tax=Rarobacter incanus TaxID=153494 RepID=A0A542SLU4_9MICO|nr:prepilin-type N-terminal cleavage/methylation domain-containing protein [Rarobacter incanus]
MRRRSAGKCPGDKGMTLVELIVAMGILTVVLAIFMAGVVSMVKTTVRSETATTANDQMRNVFQRMDREIRYASDINRPGIVSGKQYVEYRYVDDQNEGVATCVQWRYDSSAGELQRREWTEGKTSTITSWITLVTKGRNNLSVADQLPFTFYRAGKDLTTGVTYTTQRLRVHLDAGLGSFGDGRGSQLDTVFIARNSTDQAQTNLDSDNDGVTDVPVCLGDDGVTRS